MFHLITATGAERRLKIAACNCGKPSVARNIAKVLHATNVKDGYWKEKNIWFPGVLGI